MRGANVLTLRRANVFRICGSWQHEDYDVFDGERDVGRVYLVDHRAFQVPAALERSTATAVPPDTNVILSAHGRKENQRVMNPQLSTSISRKRDSENHEDGGHSDRIKQTTPHPRDKADGQCQYDRNGNAALVMPPPHLRRRRGPGPIADQAEG
jgi:hypothetical protein